jgi:hypothetical protein
MQAPLEASCRATAEAKRLRASNGASPCCVENIYSKAPYQKRCGTLESKGTCTMPKHHFSSVYNTESTTQCALRAREWLIILIFSLRTKFIHSSALNFTSFVIFKIGSPHSSKIIIWYPPANAGWENTTNDASNMIEKNSFFNMISSLCCAKCTFIPYNVKTGYWHIIHLFWYSVNWHNKNTAQIIHNLSRTYSYLKSFDFPS